MVLAVALAVVSVVLGLRGWIRFGASVGNTVLPPTPVQPGGLLLSVLFGVLAGVAFFTGLACFFWSAMTEARQQRAEIVSGLERLAGQRQAGEGA